MMKLRFLLPICLLLFCFPLYAQNKTDDLRLNNIVIDAGHGGKDPGTVSPDRKTFEKTLTLNISKKLSSRIKEVYPDMNVSLTRNGDSFVELMSRAKFASNRNAQLFISIHINASASSRNANGFSVYILGQSSRKNTDSYALNMEVLKRENSVIELEDDQTKYLEYDASPESKIMMQLMSNAFREQSLLFAQMLNDNMKGPFKHNIGVHQDNFCVLRLASMPAVLVELGYMTNSSDLAVLRSEENIDIIVENMMNAIIDYKTVYDSSVTSGNVLPAPKEIEEDVFYGTQVLASSKLMIDGDPFFKGYEFKTVNAGGLYKYIIGFDVDRESAEILYRKIKSFFPDSFFVRISEGKVTRE